MLERTKKRCVNLMIPQNSVGHRSYLSPVSPRTTTIFERVCSASKDIQKAGKKVVLMVLIIVKNAKTVMVDRSIDRSIDHSNGASGAI
jgi:hypothetical protein